MLRTIEMYTNEYKDTTQKEIRKKKGQFFTPAEVSMRMAAVENKYPKNQLIRVLDPGAGNGILSFAVIDKLLRSGYKRLDITLIETDTEILPVLEYTITKIRQICESYHGVRQLIPSMKKILFRVIAAYERGGNSGFSGHIYDK